MMFIIRSTGDKPGDGPIQIKAMRKTPERIPGGAGKTDYFCVGKSNAITALRSRGWEVVELRDGWYEDDTGGGIAIFGQGRYWEVRDTPFSVKEAVGPEGETAPSASPEADLVNVRGAIFGV